MKNVTYISASAGSGKTYELTERLKNVILAGKAKPQEVILTTFTKAAASDFKEKAKAKFYEAGKVNEASALDQALIGTVDSVANVFLNRYWYLLGISPNPNVISKDDEIFFISESLSNLPSKEQIKFFHEFAETFRIPNTVDGFKKVGINYNFWQSDLKEIVNISRSYAIRDYSESIAASEKLIGEVTKEKNELHYNKQELLELVDAVLAIANAEKANATRDKRINEIERFKRVLEKDEISAIEIGFALLDMISNGSYTTKAYKNSEEMNTLCSYAEQVWTCAQVREKQIKYVENLFEIAGRWQEEYIKYKKELHIIDYTDMEEFFLKLLDEPEVQEDIRKSFKYLFVDEFQDCSPMQIKIFDRLSELVEHSIWVGDYKQAIYGFRGSDTALVKAVTDKIAKMNGEENETLGISHRSWPPIVNVCNGVFVPMFSDASCQEEALRPEEIQLDCWDKLLKEYEANKKECLKAWNLVVDKGTNAFTQVASNIAQMIRDEGVIPKNIAVLARTNPELKSLASELKKFNIPTLVEDAQFQQGREVALVTAILSLVVDSADTMARATIAYLTENGYGAAKILDERFVSQFKGEADWDYLSDIPLIAKIISKSESYRYQSVASLVESVIIEMDLYNIVKRWPNSDNSANILHSIISLAKTYEDYCVQMSLPCTISGFVSYVMTTKAGATGAGDGVQLFTYHGSKGLEWKNVILLSLDDDFLEVEKMITRNIYGVHAYRENPPTAENLYPAMTITVLPWVFGSKTNVPNCVKNMILSGSRYGNVVQNVLKEEKRLMYVAMTRPVQSLILAFNSKFGLIRLEKMGVKVLKALPQREKPEQKNKCNLLGVGMDFVVEEIADMGEWKFVKPESKILNLSGVHGDYEMRDQQPSKVKSSRKVTANIVFDFSSRIKANPDEMDKFGTCIHNIFCVLEKSPTVETVEKIIKNHQMETALPQPEDVLQAWQNLEKFLTEKYGAKVATYHELPFKHMYDGQIFNGEMDLVWETDKGVVLVDFKSYPGNKNEDDDKKGVVTENHKHYAGMYAGQFECYDRALKAAGKNVLARLVYYHVLGVVVELKFDKE